MKDDDGGAIGGILILVLLPFTMLLRAFVMTQLWSWFVVPLGVMTIGLAHAYGLTIIIALFTMALKSSLDDEKGMAYKVFKFMFEGLGVPLMMWGLGALGTLFM